MNHETSYRAEIDGLRALAVIAVIINHLDKNILPSGYLGVDIFFVISGFVITSSLASHPVQNFGGFLAGFYIRRIKRLVPALVLFVVISSVLACLFSPNPSASLKTGSASLFGLSNLYLLWQSTDYFAESTKLNIFTHTWSLGAEEQFYVLFPFVFWFTGFGRLAAKGSKKLFITMGVLSVASLISFVYLYQTNQPAAYFLMPTRFWEIGAGCLLFLGLKHSNRFPRALTLAPPLVITFAIIAVLFAPLHFAVAATIAVVVLTVTLIACIRPGTVAHRLFSHKLLVYIGSLSYSLYLWHWSILSISSRTIGAYLWMAPVQVALMFLPSMASYKYVETPLRRSMWSPSRIRTIAYGLSGLALAGLFVLFLSFNARHLSLFKENKEMNYATHWEGWSNCDYVNTPDPKSGGCKYLANKEYPLRVAVIGDSHAGQLASGLRDILPSIPSSMAITLYAGCYPVMNSDCDFTREAYNWVLHDPGIDVVVLAAYHNLTVNEKRLYMSAGNPNAIADDAFSGLEENLRATINSLTSSGKLVLMIVDSHELLLSPELEVNPWSGVLREPGSLDVSRQSVIARNKHYYDLLDKIASENPNFLVFYGGNVFCDHNICKSDVGGKPLFQSEDHLTPFGSKVLASKFQHLLISLLEPAATP